MAWLETRNGSVRVVFRYGGSKKNFTVGEVSAAEATAFKASTEELLRLLARKVVSVPPGCPIEEFMFHRGHPPAKAAAVAVRKKELTLRGLWKAYVQSQKGKLEETTLDGIELHFDHLTRLLGDDALVSPMTRADLQGYVESRASEWIDPDKYRRARLAKRSLLPPKRAYKRKAPFPRPAEPKRPKRHPSSATIRKEIVSLRTAWNWARRFLDLAEEFPGTGLDYKKTEESLPFMTWEEAEQRVANGDDPAKVWECVYLKPGEIAELLAFVRTRPVSPWVYPILCFAAHTGARRSEIVRAQRSDLNLARGVVTIREKKRDKKKLTTREVPLTPFLKGVMADWLDTRSGGQRLFCKSDGKAITPREAMNYFDRALRTSKWFVLRGLHMFRHSFISALASQGVDQRIIDDMVGHQTDEQRRRYRHLYPSVKAEAIADVFG